MKTHTPYHLHRTTPHSSTQQTTPTKPNQQTNKPRVRHNLNQTQIPPLSSASFNPTQQTKIESGSIGRSNGGRDNRWWSGVSPSATTTKQDLIHVCRSRSESQTTNACSTKLNVAYLLHPPSIHPIKHQTIKHQNDKSVDNRRAEQSREQSSAEQRAEQSRAEQSREQSREQSSRGRAESRAAAEQSREQSRRWWGEWYVPR
jgi:hypothetical protein